MDEKTIRNALQPLELPAVRYLPVTASTNTEALQWAAQGAPDLAVVIADEQTAGRGRDGRRWHTPPGAALAVSVVLRAGPDDVYGPPRLAGLGAISIALALRDVYGLPAQIKWPNDVLLSGRKVAGVLVETVWQGDAWQYAVVGMGVNVRPAAVPADVRFPATDIERVLGKGVVRSELLYEILKSLVAWRSRLGSPAFMQTWEGLLAYRGETVTLMLAQAPNVTGTLVGLADDGVLRLRLPDGGLQMFSVGEIIHLRLSN